MHEAPRAEARNAWNFQMLCAALLDGRYYSSVVKVTPSGVKSRHLDGACWMCMPCTTKTTTLPACAATARRDAGCQLQPGAEARLYASRTRLMSGKEGEQRGGGRCNPSSVYRGNV